MGKITREYNTYPGLVFRKFEEIIICSTDKGFKQLHTNHTSPGKGPYKST